MNQTKFIEKVSNKINELGLAGPAIVLLEAHKPLAFVSSQLLLVAQPTLDLFFSRNHIRNLAELMADSGQVEALIVSLEKTTAKQPTSKEIGP
jgi:hypothetical protein